MSRKDKTKEKEKILNSIPIFLAKTYRIVDNPAHKTAIQWNPEGNGFIIKNVTELTEKVFPKYFKHGNFPSFVRQLNLYGFRKLRSAEQGQIFTHQYFCKDQPEKLQMIHRRNRQQSKNSQQPGQRTDQQLSVPEPQYLAMIPTNSSVKQTELQGQLMTLSQKHESLQNLVSILVEQNKEIIMQNKNFVNKINKMDDNYRKKLETLIFLMVFGLKNGDNSIIIPQQLSNMIRAFTSNKKQKKQKKSASNPSTAVQLFKKSNNNQEGRFNNKNIEEILQMLELQSDNEGDHDDRNQLKRDDSEIHHLDHPSPIPSLRSYPSNLMEKQKGDDWNQLLGSLDHSDFLDFQERA